MSAPKVTVVVAAFEAEAHIGATLRSVVAQTEADWECVIVDDASTDATASIVKRFVSGDGRFRLLERPDRGGPFAAANDGIGVARGRYIARVDADDISPPHRLARQIEFLEGQPGARACISPWMSFRKDVAAPASVTWIPSEPAALRWYLGLHTFSSHSSLFIERAALLELGGYRDLPAAQDYRLICQLSRLDWLSVVPEILAFVRRHPTRLSQRIGQEQEALGVEVLREHLSMLGGSDWSLAAARALWRVGIGKEASVGEGLRAFRRWMRCWLANQSLGHLARRELAWFGTQRLRRYLAVNRDRELVSCVVGLAATAARHPATVLSGWSRRRPPFDARVLSRVAPDA